MLDTLSSYPLLLLFVVASLGYFIGNIRIRGGALGVVAVLFTGLVFGAIDERLQIPEIIFLLGLSIYVYSIGLSSGPAFFESYKKNGLRDFLLAISTLIFSGLVAAVLWWAFDFSAATITGIYTGSTTNTPALAGVLDFISNTAASAAATEMSQEAVVAYSFSYPMGVLGSIIAIVVVEKLLRIDYKKEKESLRKVFPLGEDLGSMNVQITNPEYLKMQLRDLYKKHKWDVIFGRLFRGQQELLCNYDVVFQEDDQVMIVGSKKDLALVSSLLGQEVDAAPSFDRQNFDMRRIFVSNPKLVGRTLASLNISQKFHAVVTRIRRGDVDMLATSNSVLELGDRIRFIARREDLKELSAYFGDSYKASSKVNLFSFGLGIGLGLILGTIEFNLGPNLSFKLGYAGGPLIVGLVLGALRRTGPISWTLPYSANITLQQIGLIFLLTAIGVKSGNAFVQSFSIDGLWIFLAGSVISLTTAVLILVVGYKIAKVPFTYLMGMVANQPAILEFATARAGNRIPEFGYAMVFPIAMISKVLIAQLLFLFLN